MTAQTQKVDVLAVMKLVRAYGKACARDGARCAGVIQQGHAGEVISRRIAVEKAIEGLVSRCPPSLRTDTPLTIDAILPEWKKFVESGKRPNYFRVDDNEMICFAAGYNAALAGGAA